MPKQRLIAFAAVEGIHFSGAFCAIFWLKQCGLLPGLCFANTLISCNEALHRDFACQLHHRLLMPASRPHRIQMIIKEAVAMIEQTFICDAIPVAMLGMNSELMSRYVQFVSDHLLVELGQPKLYRVENPFPWMQQISLQNKANFFERRVGEYSKSGVGVLEGNHEFSLDADFLGEEKRKKKEPHKKQKISRCDTKSAWGTTTTSRSRMTSTNVNQASFLQQPTTSKLDTLTLFIMTIASGASTELKEKEDPSLLYEYIQNTPKVEVHAHLNGCIRESTLFELAKERNVTLSPHHFAPPKAAATTTSSGNDNSIQDENGNKDPFMYNILPRSLEDCFGMFAEIPACVDDLPALRRITREALEDFARHHVAYLELRSTPKCLLHSHSCRKPASKRDYLETVLAVLRDFEREELERFERKVVEVPLSNDKSPMRPRLPMVCRFIVSIDRSQTLQDAQENAELAMDLFQQNESLVVGVDLGGNPAKQDFRLFAPIFTKVRESGLKVTLHCAEISCGNDNGATDSPSEQTAYQEATAMLAFQPDRLGHALLLPPSLQKILADKNIPIETCPTSNVMTLELAKLADGNLVHGLHQHPTLQHWLESGHPLTVATDDPGVFDTNATQELILLTKAFDLDRKRIGRLVLQSMEYVFCDKETKNEVSARIEQRLCELG